MGVREKRDVLSSRDVLNVAEKEETMATKLYSLFLFLLLF